MYGLCTMYRDKRYPKQEADWRFPEDWERKYDWPEACARALTQAYAVQRAASTLTVEGAVRPHEGCLDDAGEIIPPGMCGEPPERYFLVKVEDEDSLYVWTVT